MIKYNDLQVGDYVIADYDGKKWEGEVINLNGDEKQICVRTDVQEFWFDGNNLDPILLDEGQLFKLGFQKQQTDDGELKYMKGAFRVLLHKADDFSNVEVWYREDRRHFDKPLYVHELQNHHLQMTKIPLKRD